MESRPKVAAQRFSRVTATWVHDLFDGQPGASFRSLSQVVVGLTRVAPTRWRSLATPLTEQDSTRCLALDRVGQVAQGGGQLLQRVSRGDRPRDHDANEFFELNVATLEETRASSRRRNYAPRRATARILRSRK
jgi:hypothetical protein